MKAQFALIEAAIALVLVASAATFVSSQMNLMTANYDLQEGVLQRSSALYDIADVMRQNTSANGCLSLLYMENRSSCISNLTKTYAQALGLSGIELTTASRQPQNAQNTSSACFAVFLKGAHINESVCAIVKN